jgi:type IV fimbrial biogenesis protein FimT
MKNLIKGVTLIELSIVISICSIILMLASPALKTFTIKNKLTSQVNKLASAINLARHSAITLNRIVTLCRSENLQQCQGKWHQGMILFVDHNRDHIVNGSDYILRQFEQFPKDDLIFLRAFGNKQYLQMTPLGYTKYQNGTFTYCPKEGLQYARGIILNATGRVRFSKDNDGDGIDEGANGNPLRC